MNKLCCRINPKLYCEECKSVWCSDCLNTNDWSDISFSHHKLPDSSLNNRGWACPVGKEVTPKKRDANWYHENPTILTKKTKCHG